MEIREKLYPYPVLSKMTSDYVDSSFETKVDVKLEGDFVMFGLHSKLINEEMNRLISQKQIEFVFHFECPKTAFRKVISTYDTIVYETIPKEFLYGKLSICSFIIVKEKLSSYTNYNLEDNLKGILFSLEKGSIIAVGDQFDILIEKDNADLLNRASVFSIIRNADKSQITMLTELNEDKIIIKLPEEEYIKLNNIKNEPPLQSVINSIIVLPSLVFTLSYIMSLSPEEINELEDRMWFRVIKRDLYKKFDIDINFVTFDSINIMDIAQKMIGNPALKAISTIYQGYGDIKEDGDDEN